MSKFSSMLAPIPRSGDYSGAALGVPSEALLHPRGLFSPLVVHEKNEPKLVFSVSPERLELSTH